MLETTRVSGGNIKFRQANTTKSLYSGTSLAQIIKTAYLPVAVFNWSVLSSSEIECKNWYFP
jgi:hypothetical protein